MIEMAKKMKPEEALTPEYVKEYKQYCKDLKETLELSELPASKQKSIYNLLTYRQSVILAYRSLDKQIDAIEKEMQKVKKQYENEPDNAKANILADRYNKLHSKGEYLIENCNHFADEIEDMKKKKDKQVKEYQKELDLALNKKGYELVKPPKKARFVTTTKQNSLKNTSALRKGPLN